MEEEILKKHLLYSPGPTPHSPLVSLAPAQFPHSSFGPNPVYFPSRYPRSQLQVPWAYTSCSWDDPILLS